MLVALNTRKPSSFVAPTVGRKKSLAAFSRLSANTWDHTDKRVCDDCRAKEPLFRCTQCEEEKSKAAFSRLSAKTFSHRKKRIV